jgi:hypothetical protein
MLARLVSDKYPVRNLGRFVGYSDACFRGALQPVKAYADTET